MKIPQSKRAEQLLMQRQSLLSANVLERKLYNARMSQLKSVINELENIPVNKWVDYAPTLLNEPYLKEWFSKLYLTTGLPMAKMTVNNFLNRKSGTDIWEQSITNWISKNAGKKVTIINDSFKQFFSKELQTALDMSNEFGRLSVEQITTLLYDRLKKDLPEIISWQVRRIVQTETLTSLSVAANESVKELNIGFTKTWGISGHNTRPAHQEADGMTIDEGDLFTVDGELLEFPRDDSNGASAGNIINCSCFCIYSPK